MERNTQNTISKPKASQSKAYSARAFTPILSGSDEMKPMIVEKTFDFSSMSGSVHFNRNSRFVTLEEDNDFVEFLKNFSKKRTDAMTQLLLGLSVASRLESCRE
jgi:hypothetical protein